MSLTSRKPLFIAFLVAVLLTGSLSLALYLNEDLRLWVIAQMEEIENDSGEKVKRVKIERPEPNEAQVREISRNQERKKREELKRKAKEVRQTVYEIEEMAEARKKLLEEPQDLPIEPFDPAVDLADPNAHPFDGGSEALADVLDEAFNWEASPLGNVLPSDEALQAMETSELYQSIQEMSALADEAFVEGRAAELAKAEGISAADAREQVFRPDSAAGPDLSEALGANTPSDREAFQAFNQALETAVSAATQMARTAENRKAGLSGDSLPSGQSAEARQSALARGAEVRAQLNLLARTTHQSGNVQDMRSLMAENYALTTGAGGSAESGETFRRGEALSLGYVTDLGEEKAPLPGTLKLDLNRVLKQAIPGRRFDSNVDRRGWVFLDTWYVIGPWQRPAKDSYSQRFPPETLVDLDATYAGKINRSTRKAMELKWRFVQTENIRINPPDEISDAVYFAYTEIFSATALEVVVAVASDDMAKLWVNDLVVYEDTGLSPWRVDEGFRRILLKPGYNTVLIRVENGPAVCYFSVLMCPVDALR